MSVLVKKLKSNSVEAYVKGAPEVMSEICDKSTRMWFVVLDLRASSDEPGTAQCPRTTKRCSHSTRSMVIVSSHWQGRACPVSRGLKLRG